MIAKRDVLDMPEVSDSKYFIFSDALDFQKFLSEENIDLYACPAAQKRLVNNYLEGQLLKTVLFVPVFKFKTGIASYSDRAEIIKSIHDCYDTWLLYHNQQVSPRVEFDIDIVFSSDINYKDTLCIFISAMCLLGDN